MVRGEFSSAGKINLTVISDRTDARNCQQLLKINLLLCARKLLVKTWFSAK